MTPLRAAAVAALAACALVGGCGGDLGSPPWSRRASEVVYGGDDRVEYFQVSASDQRALMARSIVALVEKSRLRPRGDGSIAVEAPSWGAAAALCPGEPFAEQPAAAFCTGVLVDWDLVLTAGHCLRVHALDDFAVVFGYYYTAPDAMALDARADVIDPVAIVAEALDPMNVEPRLDYAWLRLAHAAVPPREPAPVRVAPVPDLGLAVGDALVSIGAGGGVPLKLDAGGRASDVRARTADYFVADTDTTAGSSGGGAFDSGLALAGILARGDADLATTDTGCNVTVRAPDEAAAAAEEFTYAARAVEGLCARAATASSLCRADCGDPCRALPPPAPAPPDGAGCALAGTGGRGGPGWPRLVAPLIALLLQLGRARRRPAAAGRGRRRCQSAARR